MLLFISEIGKSTNVISVFILDWAYSVLSFKTPPHSSNFTLPVSYNSHLVIEQNFTAFSLFGFLLLPIGEQRVCDAACHKVFLFCSSASSRISSQQRGSVLQQHSVDSTHPLTSIKSILPQTVILISDFFSLSQPEIKAISIFCSLFTLHEDRRVSCLLQEQAEKLLNSISPTAFLLQGRSYGTFSLGRLSLWLLPAWNCACASAV